MLVTAVHKECEPPTPENTCQMYVNPEHIACVHACDNLDYCVMQFAGDKWLHHYITRDSYDRIVAWMEGAE